MIVRARTHLVEDPFRDSQRRRGGAPHREGAAQGLAAGFQVTDLRAVVGWAVERNPILDLVVADRNLEAVAKRLQIVGIQFFLLMRDVEPLPGRPHAVALDGLGQDDGRLTLVRDGGTVGGIHLVRIVPAAVQAPQVLVGHVGDHRLEFRVLAEEVFADVGAVAGAVGLEVPVHALLHPLEQDALGVAGQQRVPIGAPDQLDDVPTRATEHAFELLDDLAVAPHRAVQALQVAVDHEDQVVEPLASGHRQRTERFRLVHLAVADEHPDLAVARVQQAAVVQVFHETRLVDSLDWPQAHGHGRKLPEIRHQVRVGI